MILVGHIDLSALAKDHEPDPDESAGASFRAEANSPAPLVSAVENHAVNSDSTASDPRSGPQRQ